MKPAHVLYFCLVFFIFICSTQAFALNVGDPFPDFTVENTLSTSRAPT